MYLIRAVAVGSASQMKYKIGANADNIVWTVTILTHLVKCIHNKPVNHDHIPKKH